MRQRIESLFHASAAGDIAKVKEILDEGCHDVNGDNRWCADGDPQGWERSPLHMAIQGGHLELAEWLLENGAEVNRQNRFGDTALTAICRAPLPGYWTDAVALLMAHGANPTIENDEHESALDLAKKTSVIWEQAREWFGSYLVR